jgi:hypothetical protein
MTNSLVFTRGELDGKLPIRRVAPAADLARVWLLCYVGGGDLAPYPADRIDCGRYRGYCLWTYSIHQKRSHPTYCVFVAGPESTLARSGP